MLPKKESNNFVLFLDLEGNETIYERVFNTIHDSTNSKDLVATLEELEVDFEFEDITEDKLKNLSLENLVLNVTDQCNLRCDYCIYSGNYEGQRVHGTKSMPISTAKIAIDIFMNKSSEKSNVLFYGGEPLIASNLIRFTLDHIARNHPEKNVQYGMTTNFTLGHQNLDFLIENNFLLSVSLDGDETIHDSSRKYPNGKGTHSRVVENLLALKERSPEYFEKRVLFSVTISTPNSLESIKDYFSQELFTRHPLSIQTVEKRFKRNKSTTASVFEDRILKFKRDYFHQILEGKEVSTFLRALFDRTVLPIYARDNERISPII